MPSHPSLSSPFIPVDPLRPVETMGRNELCWCRSGLKWKKCHYNRHNDPRPNFFKVAEESKRRSQKGYCSHAGDSTHDCSKSIIRSHTVQRRGGLSSIAEGKSRVLEVKPSWHAMVKHHGNPPPAPKGIGDASVFPGFCEFHDTEVFHPIERADLSFTPYEALLFGYRAIAYERFTKARQIEDIAFQRELDRGLPFEVQANFQQRLHMTAAGARKGLLEVDGQLAEYRRRVREKDTKDFNYRAYQFDEILPLVACGGYMPEIALDGSLLQIISRGSIPPEQITLAITSYSGKTVAMFGWIGPVDGVCSAYLDCFDKVADCAKADAIVQIAFEQLENIYLKISWWDSLSSNQREDLTRRIRSGVGLNVRPPGYYNSEGPLLAEAKLTKRRSS